jgi:hypothetical protein
MWSVAAVDDVYQDEQRRKEANTRGRRSQGAGVGFSEL